MTLLNNFTSLTVALIVMLLSSALSSVLPPGIALWSVKLVTFGTLVVAYLSLNFGVSWKYFVVSLLAIQILSAILRKSINWEYIGALDLLIMLTFFSAVAYVSAKQVLFSGVVNKNKIVGTISIYLLIGLIWACLYLIVLEFSPSSFQGFPEQNWGDNFVNAIYFSFVTLTTLGYGDISPTSPLGQVLVVLEAITGVFYIAIVVASIVGIQSSSSSHP